MDSIQEIHKNIADVEAKAENLQIQIGMELLDTQDPKGTSGNLKRLLEQGSTQRTLLEERQKELNRYRTLKENQHKIESEKKDAQSAINSIEKEREYLYESLGESLWQLYEANNQAVLSELQNLREIEKKKEEIFQIKKSSPQKKKSGSFFQSIFFFGKAALNKSNLKIAEMQLKGSYKRAAQKVYSDGNTSLFSLIPPTPALDKFMDYEERVQNLKQKKEAFQKKQDDLAKSIYELTRTNELKWKLSIDREIENGKSDLEDICKEIGIDYCENLEEIPQEPKQLIKLLEELNQTQEILGPMIEEEHQRRQKMEKDELAKELEQLLAKESKVKAVIEKEQEKLEALKKREEEIRIILREKEENTTN